MAIDVGKNTIDLDDKKVMKNIPGISLNEDDSHYFYSRAGQDLDLKTVKSWVDQYANTQVRELVLNPNAMRTSYASRVWDPIWKDYDPNGPDDQKLFASAGPEEREGFRKWVHTAWKLNHDGIDVYKEWIARARELNISPWISMRMNDVHCVNDENAFLHSDFWRKNPDFRRVKYRLNKWTDRAFDYAKKEVREYHLLLVKELLERYDFDGLELDWMRFGFHFRPGYEAEGVPILNDFVKEIKREVGIWEQKRGHKIKISARVPATYHTSVGLGMDAVAWAESGIVDTLVITPFWATIDNDMPVEVWKKLLKGTDTQIYAGLEVLIRQDPYTYPTPTNSIETVRGSAVSYLDRGADRIYLFNYMDSDTAIDDLINYPVLLKEVGSIETLAGKPRRHVLTYKDTWAPGEPAAHPLPADCQKGNLLEFRLHTGPKPESGKVMVVLGVAGETKLTSGTLEVRVNGELCGYAGVAEIKEPKPKFPLYAFDVSCSAIKRGYNLIEIIPNEYVKIGWVEFSFT